MSGPPERTLGVVEALVAVRDQCPNAAVRNHAVRALEAVSSGGARELQQQAFLVLSTIAGWRGERAAAVKQALRAFLDESTASSPQGREQDRSPQGQE